MPTPPKSRRPSPHAPHAAHAAPHAASGILAKLVRREDLTGPEARFLAEGLLGGRISPAQAGALVLALLAKGETVEEISPFAQALKESVKPVAPGMPLLADLCGTGGDAKGAFDIWGAAAFVVAGAGVPVAKLACDAGATRGGGDMLSALGVPCLPTPRAALEAVSETGLAFVAPPWENPALARAVALRRDLGISTFLDLLPVLVHPIAVTHRVIGTTNPRHLDPVARAAGELGHQRILVLHGLGLDTATLEGETRCYEAADRSVRGLKIDPLALGFSYASSASLKGGTPAENARLIERILLDEERSAKRDAVILNAAVVLWETGKARFLGEAVQVALSSLATGKAHARLRALREYLKSR